MISHLGTNFMQSTKSCARIWPYLLLRRTRQLQAVLSLHTICANHCLQPKTKATLCQNCKRSAFKFVLPHVLPIILHTASSPVPSDLLIVLPLSRPLYTILQHPLISTAPHTPATRHRLNSAIQLLFVVPVGHFHMSHFEKGASLNLVLYK